MKKLNGKDKASKVVLWQLARRAASHVLCTFIHTLKGQQTGNSFRNQNRWTRQRGEELVSSG